jgi:ribonuclease MRP protein subunit RMP1
MKIQASNSKKAILVTAKEDLGERVRRVDDVLPVNVSGDVKVPKEKPKEKSEKDGAPKATSKKKKKKNAIDDLFSGLF